MPSTAIAQASSRERSAPGSPISDALVFFGATGDLAHKKIFPRFASKWSAREI